MGGLVMENKRCEKDENLEINFLTDKDNYYLTSNNNIKFDKCEEIELSDIALYKVEEVSFEDQSPRKEALENVLSTMKIEGTNFIYLIIGDTEGVEFYYGVSRNYNSEAELDLSIMDIGEKILEPSIKGNFRGSNTRMIESEEKRKIIEKIGGMKQFSMLEGVPGATKEDEKFQGVDRLADVMMGDTFGFMIIASPVSYDDTKSMEKDLYDVYSRIVPFSKKSMQYGNNSSSSISEGTTDGTSKNVTESYSKSEQESINVSEGTSNTTTKQSGTTTTKGTSESNTSGDGCNSKTNGTSKSGQENKSTSTATGTTSSKGTTKGGSETEGTSKSDGTSKSASIQKTKGEGESSSTSLEYIDKRSQDWIKYLDEVIIPRLDYGMGKGIFVATSFLFSDSKAVIKKLENTAISLYSGETGNKVPLRSVSLEKKPALLDFLKNFQLPFGKVKKQNGLAHETVSRSALSQCMKEDKSFVVGNWLTTNELSMIAGLPQKEVVGLALKEEVEFGLNCKNSIPEENRILLGNLVQSGNELKKNPIYLDKDSLDKHIFVAGVTGSGKTTTCQSILCSSDLPFLVIEPAKTEYRIMKEKYPDMLVFTLGNENVGTPFRLNPFEFFPHENITSRADMIKASIEAAFDMEAAIPQIIESAIYACYEDYGWNIATNKNEKYEDPFGDGVYAFPTLEDLINKVPEIVEEQGFDNRLKSDYIGSIRARLIGLLAGTKGQMLNTKRSVDFRDLLERKVVLELEEIRSGSEKSLIMGFVLTNLMQAIKGKFIENGGKPHKHITLVEEAHRLLSKFVAGDSPNKKQGVETFTDMLAEIRKYGESLIIVDQIPNKLTPEILKNTNTKIVHKLFAEDDKNAIGNTIVLDKEQKEFLSNLDTGRAIVFSQGYSKAIQVQINRLTETDSETQVEDKDLRDSVYEYYSQNYKKGIILNSQFCSEKPDANEIEKLLELSKNEDLSRYIYFYGSKNGNFPDETMLEELKSFSLDDNVTNVLDEIAKAKNDKESKGPIVVRKEEQVAFLKRYSEKFEIDFLVELLLYAYYESKTGKKKQRVNKKLKSKEYIEQLTQYIADYISNEHLTLERVRCIYDML
jgi:hypothetical protein